MATWFQDIAGSDIDEKCMMLCVTYHISTSVPLKMNRELIWGGVGDEDLTPIKFYYKWVVAWWVSLVFIERDLFNSTSKIETGLNHTMLPYFIFLSETALIYFSMWRAWAHRKLVKFCTGLSSMIHHSIPYAIVPIMVVPRQWCYTSEFPIFWDKLWNRSRTVSYVKLTKFHASDIWIGLSVNHLMNDFSIIFPLSKFRKEGRKWR